MLSSPNPHNQSLLLATMDHPWDSYINLDFQVSRDVPYSITNKTCIILYFRVAYSFERFVLSFFWALSLRKSSLHMSMCPSQPLLFLAVPFCLLCCYCFEVPCIFQFYQRSSLHYLPQPPACFLFFWLLDKRRGKFTDFTPSFSNPKSHIAFCSSNNHMCKGHIRLICYHIKEKKPWPKLNA